MMFVCKRDTKELSIIKTERCNDDSMRLVYYFVKRLDDIIPVPPGIGSAFVPFETMSIGIMSQIKPVLGDAHNEPGMTNQAVDQFPIRIRTLVGKKGVDCFRGGRETVKVVGKASDEGVPLSLWRKLQTVFLELFLDERIYASCRGPLYHL